MKISEKLKEKKTLISFEIFPPKPEVPIGDVIDTVKALTAMSPDFMSVTYGASGSNSKNTLEVANIVQDNGITALAHLTCVASTKNDIEERLSAFKDAGIENILALRGDIPEGSDFPDPQQYKYACELIEDIHNYGDFCVSAACYPEGHIECPDIDKDIVNLKTKVSCGVDMLITQMFFDNEFLYRFLDKAEKTGIYTPVHAGIMPVTNAKMIIRSCALSGASVPAALAAILEKYGSDPASMRSAGIDYATEQILDLMKNGVHGIHIYTMNRPSTAEAILKNIG